MTVGSSVSEKKLLVKMLRVMFPHERFPDKPYEEAINAVIDNANSSIAQKSVMSSGLKDLNDISFLNMSDQECTDYLKKIENSSFFSTVHGTGLVALYNNHDVWKLLGYEGPSYDKGGYIDRGFNDLDWLPEPRITEYNGE